MPRNPIGLDAVRRIAKIPPTSLSLFIRDSSISFYATTAVVVGCTMNVRLKTIFPCVFLGVIVGCGTTRWSDTTRTATEQRLIANAIDEAVAAIDARELSGRKVFFDESHVDDSVQKKYLISSLRHRLLRQKCLLQEKLEDAEIVVEARAGVVGTDRHDMMVGIPQTTLPAVMPGVPSQIPEMAVYKKTNQKGFVKIGLFAYRRADGSLVWDSNGPVVDTSAKTHWAFGVGPIQSDPDGGATRLAGEKLPTLSLPSLPPLPSLPQMARQPEPEPEKKYRMPKFGTPPEDAEGIDSPIQPAGTTTVHGDR